MAKSRGGDGRKKNVARPRSPRKRRSRSSISLSSLLVRSLGVFAVAVLLAATVYLWPRCLGDGCPDVRGLREYTPPQASRVFDGNGQILAHLAPERRIVVPLERIPVHVVGAFLAVEDRRFFDHGGIDLRRVAGAALHDLQALRFEQGFSTITMQLARNVFPEHLTRAKTVRRKVWEMVIALRMEREFAKNEILEMYLNQIYLGEGYYGVEAAAQGYFGKTATQLGIAEAAMLAALPRSPNNYNPRQDAIAAVRRRNLVLRLMADARVISGTEATAASARPLGTVPPSEVSAEAPYFIAAIRRELRERYGPGAETAGLRIHTSLDRALQRSAVENLRRQLASVEKGEQGRFTGPVCGSGEVEDPSACLQGMFVALDARTGDVLALVGGRDFRLSQFDRVTQAHRQAGSAFKPFLYATALGSGVPITTTLLGPGAADYEGGYRPADHVSSDVAIDLREAMRLSSNQAAVELGGRVGVGSVVRTARSLGITTPMQNYPSTLLGAAEVVPIELVSAFSAFASNGVAVAPRLIRRVEGADGRVLWEDPVRRSAVLTPEVAFLTTSLLQDVMDRGTGWRARSGGLPGNVPAAGKTGTTNDAADAWFVGYTPEIVAGVWVGFDKRQRISGTAGGGSVAAPIWGRVMAEYYRDRPAPMPWVPPFNVVSERVDRESGYLATSSCPDEHVVEEWFIRGTEPRGYCPLHDDGLDGWIRRGIRGIEGIFGRRRG